MSQIKPSKVVELRSDINRVLKSCHPPKPNVIKAEYKGIQQLKRTRNKIILTADKWGGHGGHE